MDHYIVTVHDTAYEIGVDDIGTSRFSVTVDGEQLEVTLQLKDAAATKVDNSNGVTRPSGSSSSADNTQTFSASEPSTPTPSSQGAGQMTAPMPGVIAEVRTSSRTAVSKGDTLLVLEAMKMKNELHADHSAVVEALLVKQGDQVKYGQPLIQFKEA